LQLVVPAIDTELTAIGNSIFKLASVDWATVWSQLATEIRIIILTGLIEGRDVAVATTPLAVGLGVVCVKIVAAGESAVAARDPADMRLLFGVALHMTLEVLLALETTLAARLLALELHLLDD
jgi:hypothetical protein